jgi:hypothetical protein
MSQLGSGEEGIGHPPGRDPRSDLFAAGRIIVGVGSVVAAVALIPAGSALGRIIIALALATGVFQLFEILEWRVDKRCGSAEAKRLLEHALANRATAMVVLTAASLCLTSAKALVIIAACTSANLYLSFRRINKWLRDQPPPDARQLPDEIEESTDDEEQRSPRTCEVIERDGQVIFVLKAPNAHLELELTLDYAEKTTKLLSVLRNWRKITGYASLSSALLLILTTSALGLGVFAGKWIGPHAISKHLVARTVPPPPHQRPRHHKAVAAATSSPGPPLTKPRVTPPVWNGSCPAVPYQSEAKEPAIVSIVRLYKTESHLESLAEGCVGHISTHHFHKELYVTMAGINPDTYELLSYAIVSEHHSPVIVLQSLAPLIEKLVAKVGPVGGLARWPHYAVEGSGEMYVILAPFHNTYLFVRRNSADEWVELVPTAARAFLGLIKETGWMWPSKPIPGPNGGETIRLWSANAHGSRGDTITLEADGEARRSHWRYPTDQPKELNVSELIRVVRKT